MAYQRFGQSCTWKYPTNPLCNIRYYILWSTLRFSLIGFIHVINEIHIWDNNPLAFQPSRLLDDGSVPPDNPFADSADAQPAIWSYGHRNIQGLAYDPLRSMVWASEHGALGGDEPNLIQAGRNYGWPTVTFSREYFDGSKISPHTSKPGMVDPVAVWMTAIASAGLVVYSGTQFEQWGETYLSEV